jgi:hypothetical protein
VERATGIHDPQLDVPEIPHGFESWFARYLSLRTGDGVSWQDIDSYERVQGTKLTPVEIEGIFAMERAASSVIAQIIAENAGGARHG